MIEYYIKNQTSIPYEIQYKKNKYTYFRVRDGRLIVTTNKKTTKQQIHHFIDQKFDQIYKHINLQLTSNLEHEIKLWGKTYGLNISQGRFKYFIEDQMVYVSSMLKDYHAIKKRIYLYELEDKLESIKEEIELNLAKNNLETVPYKLKYLKSKFGSYHRKHHEITLNTFLSTLDPIYLKYVLYHEYAHVRVFNHSKAFYQQLTELMPDHRIYQKDLKKIAIP